MSAWGENIERVRELLGKGPPLRGDARAHDEWDDRWKSAHAALTALTAQMEELEEALKTIATGRNAKGEYEPNPRNLARAALFPEDSA